MIQINAKKEKMIQNIAKAHRLRLLFLFGSQVSGKTHKESDFDFGFIANRTLSPAEEGRLIGNLMPIAEVNDERLINLVNFQGANPLLRRAAGENAELLYEKESGMFAEFQAYAFKSYIETLPLFRLKAERMGISTP